MRFLARIQLILSVCGFCCGLGLALSAAAESPKEVKSDSLRYLQDLREQNTKRLKEIDETLAKRLEDAATVGLEAEVTKLREQKKEHLLRQQFLDDLIFQFDSKFTGLNMKSFVEQTLQERAKVYAASQVDSGLWKFLKYASDAVRKLPEQRENILGFLEGYMNRSVANPIRPDEYLNSRNYTNGSRSESGKPIARDVVGEVADRRLQEVSKEQSAPQQKTGL